MCNFFSALVVRNGDVLWHEATDSHSLLVRHFKLPDDRECRHFAKIEFTPQDGGDGVPQYLLVDSYVLTVDEATEPAWFKGVRDRVVAKCRSIVRAMIVDGEADVLLGGKWVLGPNAKVKEIHGANVRVMLGSSSVGEMRGSSSVGEMWESYSVGAMRGSSSVGEMWESSSVGAMWGSSKVGEMWGSSKVIQDRRVVGA